MIPNRASAFFATIGLAGLRPSEAANLLVQEVGLPDQGWGLARLRGATTSPGQPYTADNAGGSGIVLTESTVMRS